METMILSLSNLKSLKEVAKYITELKNNKITKWHIENVYGSFDKFEKAITDEWIKINCNKAAEESTITKENCQDCKSDIKESINAENNIGKKCVIFNDPYTKDGAEGVIKDVVKEAQKYVVVVGGSNINYVNFENVKIDEWKDIIIKGYDDKINNYKITISKDKIIINTWCDDVWIQEENNTYELKLDKKVYEKIDCNWENYRGAVLEYILAEVKSKKINKEYEEVCDKIKELENRKDKLLGEYEKEYDYTISLWKGLM